MGDGTAIGQVLDGGSRAVVTVTPGETIRDAVDLLDEHGIGAVVVTGSDSTVAGILSERDVVRHLCREQEGTLRLRVEDLMTRNVEVCRLEDRIEGAMAKMIAGHFRHMPVVTDDGQLCGIVSLADLALTRLRELES